MKGQFSLHLRQPELLTSIEPASATRVRQEARGRGRTSGGWRRQELSRKISTWLRLVVFFAPVLGLLYAIYGVVPVYRAEATLLIDTQADRSLSGYTQVIQSAQATEDHHDKTQYELLRKRSLAGLVIREQGLDLRSPLDKSQDLKLTVHEPDGRANNSSAVSVEATEAYLHNLEIVSVQGTRLVKVAFLASDPRLAAQIANAHAEAFIRQSQEQARDTQLRPSRFTLVDKAIPPSRPTRSRTTSRLMLGLGFWVLGSGGLLYWSTRFTYRLKTPADVTRILDLATLGIIPDFSTKEVRAEGAMPLPAQLAALPGVFPKELLLAYHPLSLVPEAYRNLRAELLLSRPSAPPRLLLMTSGMSGEGKTLTVLNTAISLAQMGARVLIIDADLRHPHCHSVLKMPKGLGLTEFLTGQRELAEVIQTTRVDRLFFLSGGGLPPNPAELLGSKRMRAALSFLSHLYDYIVIDSPPLGLVRDALLLSPWVDGVVLVVNSPMTHHKVVQEAQDRLIHIQAKVLGVVLNKMDAQSRDYVDYCRRYRAYYRQAGGADEDVGRVDPMSRRSVPTATKIEPVKKTRKNIRKVEQKADTPLLGVVTPRVAKGEAALPQKSEHGGGTQQPDVPLLSDRGAAPSEIAQPLVSSLTSSFPHPTEQLDNLIRMTETITVSIPCDDGEEPTVSHKDLDAKDGSVALASDDSDTPKGDFSNDKDAADVKEEVIRPS